MTKVRLVMTMFLPYHCHHKTTGTQPLTSHILCQTDTEASDEMLAAVVVL